jgi:hypothetical protein
MEDIDKLPLGIYKSIFNKAIQSLNNPILYADERMGLLPSMFKATEMYSPCYNTDFSVDENNRRRESKRFNKENRLRSQQTFLEDYIKSLEDGI